MGFGLQSVCCVSSYHASPLLMGKALPWDRLRGEKDSVYRRSSLLFPIKTLARKHACHFSRQSQRQIPMLNSEPSSPQIAAFLVTISLLLWVVGLLVSPGGEWVVGSTAVWKYSPEAIQTQGERKREARQEEGPGRRPFAFPDTEESPFTLPQTQLVTYFMLCLYGELLNSL